MELLLTNLELLSYILFVILAGTKARLEKRKDGTKAYITKATALLVTVYNKS